MSDRYRLVTSMKDKTMPLGIKMVPSSSKKSPVSKFKDLDLLIDGCTIMFHKMASGLNTESVPTTIGVTACVVVRSDSTLVAGLALVKLSIKQGGCI